MPGDTPHSVPLGRRLGRWLSRRPYVARAMEERADLSAFDGRPSLALVLGLILIGLSFLLGGWPTLAALAAAALWLEEPLVAALGIPAAYGLSWGVWGLGVLISGKESLTYGNQFARWGARRLTERLLGDEEADTGEDAGG